MNFIAYCPDWPGWSGPPTPTDDPDKLLTYEWSWSHAFNIEAWCKSYDATGMFARTQAEFDNLWSKVIAQGT